MTVLHPQESQYNLKSDEGQAPGDMSGVEEDFKPFDSKHVCQSFLNNCYSPRQKAKEMH